MASKVYEIVTEKILAALESGTAPWRKTRRAADHVLGTKFEQE